MAKRVTEPKRVTELLQVISQKQQQVEGLAEVCKRANEYIDSKERLIQSLTEYTNNLNDFIREVLEKLRQHEPKYVEVVMKKLAELNEDRTKH